MKPVCSRVFFLAVRAFYLLGLISITLALPETYRKYAMPFRIAKITSTIELSDVGSFIANEDRSLQVAEILNQPLTYLNKGRQSFAFESFDGRYVLKLFKSGCSGMNYGSSFVSGLKSFVYKKNRKEIKLEETLMACRLSFDLLQEETGIVWAHLNLQENIWPLFEVRDHLGFSHWIDPSKYRFVIQKKGERMFDSLYRALKEDPIALNRMVQSFAVLLQKLEEKNILIADEKMPSNFGYFGEMAFQLDFASNLIDPNRSAKQIGCFREKLRRWLEKMAPNSVKYLE